MNKSRQYHSDLGTLLQGIFHVPSALNTQIHGLVSDSRQVKQGDLFIALPGINSRAEDYVDDAIERGAAAVLINCREDDSEKDREVHEDGRAIELYVPNLKSYVGEIAHRFFHRPSEEMQVIGITGTNGKTSVANYIAQFFGSLGISSAVIGTLGYGLCAKGESLIDTRHTTPDVVDVHRYLAHLRDAGAELVAMEVSSHGLAQNRVACVHFEGAVFTNISRDHLDFHESMDAYAEEKAKLFAWPSLKYAVINIDDEYAKAMFQVMSPDVRKVRYSLQDPVEVFAESLDLGLEARGVVNVGTDKVQLISALLGEFNVYNLLSVLGVALAKGANKNELPSINQLRPVAGRMQTFKAKGSPTMVVDYAHTPDALENVLKTLGHLTDGNVITVFGCGGDRDKGKRSEMGKIAAQYSNLSVITNDNPRTEDPLQIISDIEQAFEKGHRHVVMPDRAEAIKFAFEQAREQDIVLVAGKGHENYQEVNGLRTYFSDADQCEALLGMNDEARA